MSFEILSPSFKIPSLTIISYRRAQAAKEFKYLHSRVKNDPNATIFEENNIEDSDEYTVTFWQDTSKKLSAVTDVTISDDKTHFELSVIEQSGKMSYRVAEQDFFKVDIEADPFAQLILDYFRKQYGNN